MALRLSFVGGFWDSRVVLEDPLKLNMVRLRSAILP